MVEYFSQNQPEKPGTDTQKNDIGKFKFTN